MKILNTLIFNPSYKKDEILYTIIVSPPNIFNMKREILLSLSNLKRNITEKLYANFKYTNF
jgi:hypothetical protein